LTNNYVLFVLTDPSLLSAAIEEVREQFDGDVVFPFIPQWMLIVTWNNVTFSGSKANIVSD
jgi:hypothetical protein